MAKKAPAKPAAKRKPRAKKPVQPKPLVDELQIIKPVPEEIISFNAGQVLTGGYLRKRLNLNGQIETYSLAPIETKPAKPETPPNSVTIIDPIVKSSSPWRRFMLVGIAVAGLAVSFGGGVWSDGGINVGPKPKNDIVSKVFDAQEASFRELSPERAKALRAGEIKSEAESVAWMSSRFLPKAEAAWTPLLTAEKAAFGGEQWTAEKEAKYIEEYAR